MNHTVQGKLALYIFFDQSEVNPCVNRKSCSVATLLALSEAEGCATLYVRDKLARYFRR